LSAAAGEVVHAFRPTIFARERTFRLGDDALVVEDGATTRTIPLASVVAVRIYKQPGGGMGPAIRRAIVTLAGGETLVVQSSHYLGFARIEDRAASYRAFAAALVERVLRANPSARITVGHSWLAWSLWLALLVGAIAVLALGAILLVQREFPLAALLYIGIVAAFVPTMWRVVRDSRPRAGDPHALPAAIFE
jgi:hypothetical protein